MRRIKEGAGYKKLVSYFSDAEFKAISKEASNFNRNHEWSVVDAVLLAYLVCEDANAHNICKIIEDTFDKLYD